MFRNFSKTLLEEFREIIESEDREKAIAGVADVISTSNSGIGTKHDQDKPQIRKGLLEYFPRACIEVAKCSAFGAKKYDWDNWKLVENAVERYGEAEVRHIVDAAINGDKDDESGLSHATHAAWNAMARLELELRERDGV